MNEQVLKLAEQARAWLDANGKVGACVRLDSDPNVTYSVHRMNENCVLVETNAAMSNDAPVFKLDVGVPAMPPFRFLHVIGSWKGGQYHAKGERAPKAAAKARAMNVLGGNIFATVPNTQAQASVLHPAAAANTFSMTEMMAKCGGDLRKFNALYRAALKAGMKPA